VMNDILTVPGIYYTLIFSNFRHHTPTILFAWNSRFDATNLAFYVNTVLQLTIKLVSCKIIHLKDRQVGKIVN
jgi:hypothetical protein